MAQLPTKQRKAQRSIFAENALAITFKVSDFFLLKESDIDAILNDIDATVIDRILAKAIKNVIEDPGKNLGTLSMLLDRYAGKVRDEIPVKDNDTQRPAIIEIIAHKITEKKEERGEVE